jgi:hypothetical protein
MCKFPIHIKSGWPRYNLKIIKNTSLLHDQYVIVSADNAPNNIVFVCKSHYIDCLIKELGLDNSLGNPTYTPTTHTKQEILDNHRSILCSFGISNTMTWLTVMEYLCHKWPRICSICRKRFSVISSFMTYHRVCN